MKLIKLLPRFAYSGQFALENLLPGLRGQSIGSNLTIDLSGATLTLPTSQSITSPTLVTPTLSGAVTATSTMAVTGVITPTGGIAAAGGFTSSPRTNSTGDRGFVATTGATQTQIVTTDTYFAEVFIPANSIITGISVLNGHTTNASVNLTVGLATSAGTIVAKSATTVAQSTADAYQQIPFTATYQAVGPATYYICVQGSTTTGYLATHTIGNFGAKALTSETYGTFLTTASYSTTTFTTAVGPVADTY